jgi:hypothetical protein
MAATTRRAFLDDSDCLLDSGPSLNALASTRRLTRVRGSDFNRRAGASATARPRTRGSVRPITRGSVAEQQDSLEGELEQAARVDGVEEVPGVAVALGQSGLGVPILEHDAEREKSSADDERGPNEIAVHGVAHGPAAGFDLEQDTQVVLHRVHLIGNALGPALAEEHRATYLVGALLARFDRVAERLSPGRSVNSTLSLVSPLFEADSSSDRAALTTFTRA